MLHLAIIAIVIAAAGVGLSAITAAPSRADTADQTFIKVLDDSNIHYGSHSKGLAMAHAVCRELDAGAYTPGPVVGALRRDDHLSYADAAAVAAAAIAVFCPWDKS